jgi:spore maturation protein CgeB
MLILYVAPKYDYGRPVQGYSFEHYNFYDALRNIGCDILYFDFMSLLQNRGRDGMNRRLREVVDAEGPDLMFTVLAAEELDRAVVRDISENTETATVNWFCDDHWRFEDFSQHWAPCFNWVVTTARSALQKYEKIGYRNVIKSQWACNHFLYRKLDLPPQYDVTFVGQPHGNRREVIQGLRSAGIKVRAWGTGWESGRLLQEEMIHVFNQSRINLNLSNSVIKVESPMERVKKAARLWVSQTLSAAPGGKHLKSSGKRMLGEVGQLLSPFVAAPGTNGYQRSYIEQIKGRNFEIPGCGGFMLTGRPEELDEYYDVGLEMVSYDGFEGLIAKIRYFLDHEQERAAVGFAGYQRTLREHTYAHRFAEMFSRMGLTVPSLQDVFNGRVSAGQVEEVG